MKVTVADIIEVMGVIAPTRLAEAWDNVGLQVGQTDWPVKTIWIALDPSPDVVSAACQKNTDLLITHHPLIFKPLRSVDFDSATGNSIRMAAQNQLAIFAAHTNFDSAAGGLNDTLARRIGLTNLKTLDKSRDSGIYKLVVYVPVKYEKEFLNAFLDTHAAEIRRYSDDFFQNRGRGIKKPDSSAGLSDGNADEISQTKEITFESVVHGGDLDGVIEQLMGIHPDIAIPYDIYPLQATSEDWGLGRIGEVTKSQDLRSFALDIKKKLGLTSVKVAGDFSLKITRAAVCTGSGSSLMKVFLASGAQAFISGDLHYHDAKEVQTAKRGLIDIGHFASEHLIIDVLAERLSRLLTDKDFNVTVAAYRLEKDPFVRL